MNISRVICISLYNLRLQYKGCLPMLFVKKSHYKAYNIIYHFLILYIYIYISRLSRAYYFQDFINKLYCIYDLGKHPNRRATNGARHYSFIYLRIPLVC